ncbi:MAG: PD40 domain-containing protein [Bacteroidales bacterium]|nr:PD40 domain-containing protein [Bacteroidales bacterium]
MLKGTLNKIAATALMLAVFSACGSGKTEVAVYTGSPIYPDYIGVTVPSNIAPLNFHYTSSDMKDALTTVRYKETVHTFKGREVVWEMEQWKSLLASAESDTLHFSSEIRMKGGRSEKLEWEVFVSPDRIDPYLSYRLIEPGYEVWHEVEIRERCVENFDERILSDWKHTGNSCMNCHIHSQARADLSMLYVRGKNGGAFLNRNGELRKLSLKADNMVSGTVYGEIHPSGRYGVFSSNIIIPGFHTQGSRRLEVYDTESDLAIADFDRNEMIVPRSLSRKDVLETFPVFSADGKYLYYCAADTLPLPRDIEKLRYSLMKISFDEATGMTGRNPEVVWDAEEHGGSVCHPKCSPDGKWMMYTVADYGTFPIWHTECQLEMMNLHTGEIINMDAANSDRSDTYHSWSSDSRWFVFASKRGDGKYGRPYFCHVDDDGMLTKPFVLPQEDPWLYENSLKSFNIPDLSDGPVHFDAETIGRMVMEAESESYALRK